MEALFFFGLLAHIAIEAEHLQHNLYINAFRTLRFIIYVKEISWVFRTETEVIIVFVITQKQTIGPIIQHILYIALPTGLLGINRYLNFFQDMKSLTLKLITKVSQIQDVYALL